MRIHRLFVAVVLIAALVFAFGRVGAAQAQRFTTPWGDPDLQGIWNNQTPVPFERPKELAGKAFFTREEAADFERTHLKRLNDLIAQFEPISACVGDETNLPPGTRDVDRRKQDQPEPTHIAGHRPAGRAESRIRPRAGSDGFRIEGMLVGVPPTDRKIAPSSSDASQPGDCSSPTRSPTTITTSCSHPGTS